MDEIRKLASDLGRMIAKHERFLKLRAAEDAAGKDAETDKLLDSYEKQQQKLVELESKQQPIEPEDKKELQRLSEAVHGNAHLQNLARAQADYMELMNMVNRTIRGELDSDREEETAS